MQDHPERAMPPSDDSQDADVNPESLDAGGVMPASSDETIAPVGLENRPDAISNAETASDVAPMIEALRPAVLDPEVWRREWEEVQTLVSTAKPKAGGGRALLLLVTMLLFAASFFGQFSARLILMLVTACLIHELGHLAAMKLFGYRDLRVFFIPFLGAAAAGRRIDAPQWQRAVVSLAGPLPGLVLAAALAVANIWFQARWLMESVGLLILVNGINLLPMIPLDGGRLLNAVLFSRNRVLELVFEMLTAGCVIGLAWYFGAYLMMAFGAVFLLLAPLSYKSRTTANEVRGLGLPLVESLAVLPRESLLRLYAVVRAHYAVLQGKSVAKTLVSLMEIVYEKAMTASISAGATVALLVAYFIVPPVLIAIAAVAFFVGTGTRVDYTARLHEAARAGDFEKVEMLIPSGADVNGADRLGATPLHLAAEEGDDLVAGLLIAAGAAVNASDVFQNTPLHLAASAGHLAVAEALIAEGADVNAQNGDGDCPLHHAVAEKHAAVIKLLIERGARLDVTNQDGLTPLQVAKDNGFESMVKLLREHGAEK